MGGGAWRALAYAERFRRDPAISMRDQSGSPLDAPRQNQAGVHIPDLSAERPQPISTVAPASAGRLLGT